MFHSVRTYVYDRRRGLCKSAAVVGGVYLVKRYINDRLEEVKDKVMQERAARDNLKRRFRSNQEDITYTIMALIPTLGEQILNEMDVESLTQELQARSKTAPPIPQVQPPSDPPLSQSSLTSSIDILRDQDIRSDTGSASHSLSSASDSGSKLGDSSQSWVVPDQTSTAPVFVQNLSDSILTTSSVMTGNTGLSDSMTSSSAVSDSSMSRTKAELWKEVKILTFTRTLTILYSTTLLSLFTTIQLTLLARHKYIASVLQLERDESIREKIEASFSPAALFMGGGAGFTELMQELDVGLDELDEAVEAKYLTLSWWMLHVGWKDVAERVRRGVEEVFEGVSLKSKLGAIDLHRLLSDVRRRVEHEITFEGTERRIDFLSTLLPPTPETTQMVLTQGGLSRGLATAGYDPVFASLLAETRNTIVSADFERVLEVCLDRATEVLFDGLERNVFDDSSSGGEESRLRLASLLPGLARWSHLAVNGLPNELVDGLTDVREVSALSAILFSRFEDQFR